MTILLTGFDSAWTANNFGALVGVLLFDSGEFRELGSGSPKIVNYKQAEIVIRGWQENYKPKTTIVLLDQPIIVGNCFGQRPVENIIASPIGRRYGGVQPANRGNVAIFGDDAPVWKFLCRFGGSANPLLPVGGSCVFETYPVLMMIALGWEMEDHSPNPRSTGRLPKYNPNMRRTFSRCDWKYVCKNASSAFKNHGLQKIASWIDKIAKIAPKKHDQDGLDACLCLLVALFLVKGEQCLMVGNMATGYVVVPHGVTLCNEIHNRCIKTDRTPSEWLRAVCWKS